MIPYDKINRSGRKIGSKNKIPMELKKAIQDRAEEIIESIDISSLNTTQKLTYLKYLLPYALPKNISLDSPPDRNFTVQILE